MISWAGNLRLERADPAALLLDILDEARGESAGARQHTVRQLIACKGAVKAGQALSADQIAALLSRRDELQIAWTCPHALTRRRTSSGLSLSVLKQPGSKR